MLTNVFFFFRRLKWYFYMLFRLLLRTVHFAHVVIRVVGGEVLFNSTMTGIHILKQTRNTSENLHNVFFSYFQKQRQALKPISIMAFQPQITALWRVCDCYCNSHYSYLVLLCSFQNISHVINVGPETALNYHWNLVLSVFT